MCGRYSRTKAEELRDRFGLKALPAGATPRYNIAPLQEALVVPAPGSARMMLWGFKYINARAESLLDKPAFRGPARTRRCLVPADGFYEWRKAGRSREPWRFALKNGEPFAFAGLWDVWRRPDGVEAASFTIITTAANALVSRVHHRMPVILPRALESRWLDPGEDPAALVAALGPYAASAMEARELSSAVNSPRNEGPQCLEPAPQADLPLG